MNDETYRTEPCPDRPIFVAQRSYTARCGQDRQEGTVTRTAEAISHLSLQDAINKAHRWAKRSAEAALVCQWVATALGVGESCALTATVTAYSDISYLDAWNKAQAEARRQAEQLCADANPDDAEFTSTKTVTLTCPPPQIGTATATRTRVSNESQAAADALAQATAQAAAEAALDCATPLYVSTRTATVEASCEEGYTGEPQSATATVERGSLVSQEDADDIAQADAEATALSEATALLECEQIVYSSTRSATATCPEGYEGDPSNATATATSIVSQEAADDEAQDLADAAAEAGLSCEQIVYHASATVTVECPPGYVGSSQTATADGESTIDEAAAYENAVTLATAAAAAALACVPIMYTSEQEVTVECPEGYTGTPKTATGHGESSVSQEEADAAAILDGTDLATALLECEPE